MRIGCGLQCPVQPHSQNARRPADHAQRAARSTNKAPSQSGNASGRSFNRCYAAPLAQQETLHAPSSHAASLLIYPHPRPVQGSLLHRGHHQRADHSPTVSTDARAEPAWASRVPALDSFSSSHAAQLCESLSTLAANPHPAEAADGLLSALAAHAASLNPCQIIQCLSLLPHLQFPITPRCPPVTVITALLTTALLPPRARPALTPPQLRDLTQALCDLAHFFPITPTLTASCSNPHDIGGGAIRSSILPPEHALALHEAWRPLLPRMQPSELAALLLALQRMGQPPGSQWVAAFTWEAAGKLKEVRRSWYALLRAGRGSGSGSGSWQGSSQAQPVQHIDPTYSVLLDARWIPDLIRGLTVIILDGQRGHTGSGISHAVAAAGLPQPAPSAASGATQGAALEAQGSGVDGAIWVELWACSQLVLRLLAELSPGALEGTPSHDSHLQRAGEAGPVSSSAMAQPELDDTTTSAALPAGVSTPALAAGSDLAGQLVGQALGEVLAAAASMRRTSGVTPPAGWIRAVLMAVRTQAVMLTPGEAVGVAVALTQLRASVERRGAGRGRAGAAKASQRASTAGTPVAGGQMAGGQGSQEEEEAVERTAREEAGGEEAAGGRATVDGNDTLVASVAVGNGPQQGTQGGDQGLRAGHPGPDARWGPDQEAAQGRCRARAELPSLALAALGRHLEQVLPSLSATQLSILCTALPELTVPRTPQLMGALATAAASAALDQALGPDQLPPVLLALANTASTFHPSSAAWGAQPQPSTARAAGQAEPVVTADSQPGLQVGPMQEGPVQERPMQEGLMQQGPMQERPPQEDIGEAERRAVVALHSIELRQGLLVACEASMAAMSASGLATVVASVARLGWQPGRAWVERLLALLPRRLPLMSPAQLALTSWALARLGAAPSPAWWQLLLKEAAGKMSQFEAKHLAQLMWALATCQRLTSVTTPSPHQHQTHTHPHPLLSASWLHLFYDKASCQLRTADAHSLALMGWALTALGLSPGEQFLSRWCSAAERRFATASARDLAHMVWAAACMGHDPGHRWLSRLSQQLHSCQDPPPSSQDIANVSWALSRLGHCPASPRWLLRQLHALEHAALEEVAAATNNPAPRGRARPASMAWAGADARGVAERGRVSSHITATLTAMRRPLTLVLAGEQHNADGFIGGAVPMATPGGAAGVRREVSAVVSRLARMQAYLLPDASPASLPATAACAVMVSGLLGTAAAPPPADLPASPPAASPAISPERAPASAPSPTPGLNVSADSSPPSSPAEPSSAPPSSPSSPAASPLLPPRPRPAPPAIPTPTSSPASTPPLPSSPPSAPLPPPPPLPVRELLGPLLLSSGRAMDRIPPSSLPFLVWAVTRLGCRPGRGWILRFQSALMPHAGRLDPGLRAMALWALARSGWADQCTPLVERLAVGVATWAAAYTALATGQASGTGPEGGARGPPEQVFAGCRQPLPSALSQSLWALATLSLRPGKVWWQPVLWASELMLADARGKEGQGRKGMGGGGGGLVRAGGGSWEQMDKRSVVMMAWAMGRLRVRPPARWCATMCCAAAHLAPRLLDPQDMALLLTGLARCLRPAASASHFDARGHGPHHPDTTPLLQPNLQHPAATPVPQPQSDMRSSKAAGQRQQQAWEGLDGQAQTALVSALGDMLLAVARATPAPRAGVAGADSGQRQAPPRLTAQSLAMVLWGAARLQLPLSNRQREAALAAARQLLPKAEVRQLVVSCWALRQLGCQPGAKWRQEVQLLADRRWGELVACPSLYHTFAAVMEAWRLETMHAVAMH